MKCCFTFSFLVVISLTAFSQGDGSSVIDTVESANGPVILFQNNSWAYLENEPVMLSPEDDSTGLFSDKWINDKIFAYNTIRDSIRDTVLVIGYPDRHFTMPATGKLFRGFMYTHKGLDIKLNKGDTVLAAFDGVVRYTRYNRGGFGNLVIIRHYNGLETYYAHLMKSLVKVNQVVRSGDPIALGGSTGRSRGPHLHFEVRYQDVPLDPMRLIDFDGQKLISSNFPVTKEVFFPRDHDINAVYHKIKSGDTLGRLAQKYHTSVKEICAMNKIRSTTTLKIGRTLRVR